MSAKKTSKRPAKAPPPQPRAGTRRNPAAPSQPRPQGADPARKTPKRDTSDYKTVSWWEDFYRVVRQVPAGHVTTYGAVAALGGHPRSARHVGYAMAALKDTGKNRDVPWHRVLGAAPRDRAKVSIKDPIGGAVQRGLLEAEGVEFDAQGRVSLAAFGWAGPGTRRASTKPTKRASKKSSKKTSKPKR